MQNEAIYEESEKIWKVCERGSFNIFKCKLELKKFWTLIFIFSQFCHDAEKKKLTSTKLCKLGANFKLEEFLMITTVLIYYASNLLFRKLIC